MTKDSGPKPWIGRFAAIRSESRQSNKRAPPRMSSSDQCSRALNFAPGGEKKNKARAASKSQ